MHKETIALTNFRSNLYSLVDQVLSTGEPLLIERNGRLVEVRAKDAGKTQKKPKKLRDLSKIKPLEVMTEDPEWYVSPKLHEWSEEIKHDVH